MSSPDDTILDALAVQARAHPPLPAEEVESLLAGARRRPRGPEEHTLVQHHLGVVLDSAIAHGVAELDVADLFQEGSLAMIAAVGDYAAAGLAAAGLPAHLRTVVDAHLDGVVVAARRHREEDEAFVHDAGVLEAAEIVLRRRLGRAATTAELAATLGWTEERVAVLGGVLTDARVLHDESLLPYLDDLDDDQPDGPPPAPAG